MRALHSLLVGGVVALFGALTVVLAAPSAAGGPTSVMIVEPMSGRATSSSEYFERLLPLAVPDRGAQSQLELSSRPS